MNKAVFVATSHARSGKTSVSLGLMNILVGMARKVGYFRPVISDPVNGARDEHIETMLSYFNLDQEYEEAFVFSRSQIERLTNQGKQDVVISRIIAQYKALEERYDYILVDGSDFFPEGSILEFEINLEIPRNLGLPTILVEAQNDLSDEELVSNISLLYKQFRERDVEVLAAIANKASGDLKKLRDDISLALENDNVLTAAIPANHRLDCPTVDEIRSALGARVLLGHDYLSNVVEDSQVGAMQAPNFLKTVHNNTLIIVPGDRSEILMAAALANLSPSCPNISGVVLSAGLLPDREIIRLFDSNMLAMPVMSVQGNTFDTAVTVSRVNSRIYPTSIDKIETMLRAFRESIDTEALEKKIITFKTDGMTPKMFLYNLYKMAKSQRRHIVLPEGDDERIVTAAARLANMDLVDLTILGTREMVLETAMRAGVEIDTEKVNIIDPVNSPYYEDFAKTFYELRKNKGITEEAAHDTVADVSYFGTMMVYKGLADGMVSGATHTTAHTILPAFQIIKTKKDVSIVSSVFFMCLPDRVSVFGDCAVNPNPDAAQLAEIAISSADTARAFGIEPKVALLSYSSGTSGKGADVDTVREATAIARERRPDLLLEGPIQYDAAVDMKVGRSKMPDSKVAGQASVLIFPDLNTGNNTYKAVQRETGALAIGPMLQGLNKPVNDLSRGCTVDDILNTIIITAIQAQDK
ncbi:MAG TPA: phosphate acetyltransferase [Candidatus Merdimorpha stercoravium]|uniref:Phosphate acetyltransferase n=1 Tax=Candidatus Merdimorpha stercoravium TaxID=2840863 RepID=A0A9D1HCV3_9FLAO|nr:phosphate acetyltransferase [Candidatus Merdimorpha stercoravium]